MTENTAEGRIWERLGELYRLPEGKEADQREREDRTNLSLIDGKGRFRSLTQVAARVFLRPNATERYSLLPALAWLFRQKRPTPETKPLADTDPTGQLLRRLAFLLFLQQQEGVVSEDSKDLVWVGKHLKDRDWEEARKKLEKVFRGLSNLPQRPLALLERFCEPQEDVLWLRTFRLTPEELAAFEDEEKETLKMLMGEDAEQTDAAQGDHKEENAQ